jgi:mxaJ protein
MCFRFRKIAGAISAPICLAVALLTPAAHGAETNRILRIAADPNNLPFSNEKREGFENKLAELIARELGADLQYFWQAQRRGFFRETLKENRADLVMGVPADFERALTTKPYYRSSYVFVSRKERGLKIGSFDDEALRSLRIGVQLIGDDGANTPPAHALGMRGIVTNIVGFTVYGDYSQPNPPARIIDAVASGRIDVAVAWGPMAGFFVKQQRETLELVPLATDLDRSGMPLAFDISVGIRRSDKKLRAAVEEVLARCKPEIDGILERYGVPRTTSKPQ